MRAALLQPNNMKTARMLKKVHDHKHQKDSGERRQGWRKPRRKDNILNIGNSIADSQSKVKPARQGRRIIAEGIEGQAAKPAPPSRQQKAASSAAFLVLTEGVAA